MSLRWAPCETMGATIGAVDLMNARNTADIRHVLAQVNFIMFNFVFADTAGNIGWHVVRLVAHPFGREWNRTLCRYRRPRQLARFRAFR